MIFEFSQWVVDIDVEKTREFYNNASFVSEVCPCSGCRNYEKAIDFLPDEVISFFSRLGIEMKKIREVYVNYANADNTVYYGGFYHVCGKIISGENKGFSVAKDFTVLFQSDCYLLEDNFPVPAIQIEILTNIPWVLNEDNS